MTVTRIEQHVTRATDSERRRSTAFRQVPKFGLSLRRTGRGLPVRPAVPQPGPPACQCQCQCHSVTEPPSEGSADRDSERRPRRAGASGAGDRPGPGPAGPGHRGTTPQAPFKFTVTEFVGLSVAAPPIGPQPPAAGPGDCRTVP